MAFKVLIMGLPGSGKTTLANKITEQLKSKGKSIIRLNADEQRRKYHDWDFSNEGRLRQAMRFFNFSEWSDGHSQPVTEDFAIVDFIAPMPKSRGIFGPDYTIWMNTITECIYEDTQQLFLDPEKWDYRVTDFSEIDLDFLVDDILAKSIE